MRATARLKRSGRMARGLAGFGGYRRRMYVYALICELPYPLWRRSATLRRFAGKPSPAASPGQQTPDSRSTPTPTKDGTR